MPSLIKYILQPKNMRLMYSKLSTKNIQVECSFK